MSSLSRRTFLAASSAAGAAFYTNPILAKAAPATKDADYVFQTLSAIHPGLLRYQTPAEFAARHAAFAKTYEGGDFDAKVIALQTLLGAVKCGHTYINPSNQSDEVKQKLYGSRRLLPLHFRWIGDAMIVTRDPHETGLEPGTRIDAIDGVPAAQILARLLPLARADGGNDGKRRALMSMPGTNQWPMFDLYFDLLFSPGETVRLEATPTSGESRSLTLATIDRAARLEGSTLKLQAGPEDPVWISEAINGGKTRVITMPTWATYKTRWDWEGWLRGQLAEILSDGTSGIVFDLRGNEGGYNIGEGMLPFLIRKPLSVTKPSEWVRFREAPEDLRPLFNTWDASFFEIGKEARAVGDRYFEINPLREERIEPMPQSFGGKIAVLIDADNSSATFSFARQLRSAGVARLIGETTGGNLRGINGGAYFFTVLPESGIEFDIPLIGYFPGGDQPDAGLEPDETVAQTPDDIAQGRDPAMERAIAAVA